MRRSEVALWLCTLAFVLSIVRGKLCCDQDCKRPVSYGRTVQRYITRDEGFLSYPASAIVTVFSKDSMHTEQGEYWDAEIQGKRGLILNSALKELTHKCEPIVRVTLEDEHAQSENPNAPDDGVPAASPIDYTNTPTHLEQHYQTEQQNVQLEQSTPPPSRDQSQQHTQHKTVEDEVLQHDLHSVLPDVQSEQATPPHEAPSEIPPHHSNIQSEQATPPYEAPSEIPPHHSDVQSEQATPPYEAPSEIPPHHSNIQSEQATPPYEAPSEIPPHHSDVQSEQATPPHETPSEIPPHHSDIQSEQATLPYETPSEIPSHHSDVQSEPDTTSFHQAPPIETAETRYQEGSVTEQYKSDEGGSVSQHSEQLDSQELHSSEPATKESTQESPELPVTTSFVLEQATVTQTPTLPPPIDHAPFRDKQEWTTDNVNYPHTTTDDQQQQPNLDSESPSIVVPADTFTFGANLDDQPPSPADSLHQEPLTQGETPFQDQRPPPGEFPEADTEDERLSHGKEYVQTSQNFHSNQEQTEEGNRVKFDKSEEQETHSETILEPSLGQTTTGGETFEPYPTPEPSQSIVDIPQSDQPGSSEPSLSSSVLEVTEPPSSTFQAPPTPLPDPSTFEYPHTPKSDPSSFNEHLTPEPANTPENGGQDDSTSIGSAEDGGKEGERQDGLESNLRQVNNVQFFDDYEDEEDDTAEYYDEGELGSSIDERSKEEVATPTTQSTEEERRGGRRFEEMRRLYREQQEAKKQEELERQQLYEQQQKKLQEEQRMKELHREAELQQQQQQQWQREFDHQEQDESNKDPKQQWKDENRGDIFLGGQQQDHDQGFYRDHHHRSEVQEPQNDPHFEHSTPPQDTTPQEQIVPNEHREESAPPFPRTSDTPPDTAYTESPTQTIETPPFCDCPEVTPPTFECPDIPLPPYAKVGVVEYTPLPGSESGVMWLLEQWRVYVREMVFATLPEAVAEWIIENRPMLGVVCVSVAFLSLSLPLMLLTCLTCGGQGAKKHLLQEKAARARAEGDKIKTEGERNDLERRLRENKEASQSLEDDLRLLRGERDQLSLSCNQLQTEKQTAEESFATSQQELAQYREYSDQLNTQLASTNQQLADTTKQKDDGLERVEELSRLVADLQTRLDGLEAQAEQLEQDKFTTQSALDDLQGEHKEATHELEELRSKCSNLDSELGTLTTDLESQSSALQEKEEELVHLRDCLRQLTDQVAESAVDGDEGVKEAQLARIKSMLDTSKAQQELQRTIAERDTHLNHLMEKTSQLEQQIAENNVLREQLLQTETRERSTSTELRELQIKMKGVMEYFQEKESDLHRKIELGEINQQRYKTLESEAQEKAAATELEREREKEELKELRKQMGDIEKSFISQLKNNEERAEDALVQLRRTEQELRQANREVTSLKRKLAEAEAAAAHPPPMVRPIPRPHHYPPGTRPKRTRPPSTGPMGSAPQGTSPQPGRPISAPRLEPRTSSPANNRSMAEIPSQEGIVTDASLMHNTSLPSMRGPGRPQSDIPPRPHSRSSDSGAPLPMRSGPSPHHMIREKTPSGGLPKLAEHPPHYGVIPPPTDTRPPAPVDRGYPPPPGDYRPPPPDGFRRPYPPARSPYGVPPPSHPQSQGPYRPPMPRPPRPGYAPPRPRPPYLGPGSVHRTGPGPGQPRPPPPVQRGAAPPTSQDNTQNTANSNFAV